MTIARVRIFCALAVGLASAAFGLNLRNRGQPVTADVPDVIVPASPKGAFAVGSEPISSEEATEIVLLAIERGLGPTGAEITQADKVAALVAEYMRSVMSGNGNFYFDAAVARGLEFDRAQADEYWQLMVEWKYIQPNPGVVVTDRELFEQLWSVAYARTGASIATVEPEPSLVERSVEGTGGTWPFAGSRGTSSFFKPLIRLPERPTGEELNNSERALAVEFVVEQSEGSRGLLRTVWCYYSAEAGWIPLGVQCGFDAKATDWPWAID